MSKRVGYLIISILILLVACKTEKISRKPLEGKNKDFLLEKLEKNEVDFKTFSGRSAITVQNEEKKNSFKSTIRIQKDSAIWVSITPLFGIELARILLTKDSLKVINRINAEYFIGDYEYFYKKYDIALEFETVQALLIGNKVDFERDEKLKFSIDKEKYYLGNIKRRKVVKAEKKPKKIDDNELVSLWLNPTTFKIEEMLISDLTASRFVRALFMQHQEIDGKLFPTQLTYYLNESVNDRVDIEYSKITLDQPISFSFNIPSKYEQVFY
ncbi:DUF4292 domain-containing protein [Acidiluteibacter ferrifornacis]|uniref:DUF4292 domain-containing protein n=1 Tax=Acidiluteibacter ferrifornacis TaxID=2692424 RepID=A0A6N9NGP8_9FLAO|nr:DUF4292 domain-containing protein [Acidiluteibacter ferrifornacis]MBR9833557.1 DUF4292 domain-containing protein [bacterium]NBG65073.1 DUF4292 domain-containing protein [Acidiluteibacter ferrifornacis]